jgi:hypothetical protein
VEKDATLAAAFAAGPIEVRRIPGRPSGDGDLVAMLSRVVPNEGVGAGLAGSALRGPGCVVVGHRTTVLDAVGIWL